ncbi:uncharacterized protein LTHEOB_6859 [Lasiodiplodia theobromae]|uniref:uncharacterized protein n=1 Tax=Lasiodiplodia theobromae TaxID=45133 RepID=UPI0015C37C41|nr:uncharacterized protein LTHEOB_6859 [Lasiodiplodia theobromae]KAF4543125.1 hypothetical protein LTHEOB_6859 [Lasiodiplodia theobromae]
MTSPDAPNGDEYRTARPTKFRFKSKRPRDHDRSDPSHRHKRRKGEDDGQHRHHRRHHSRKHNRSTTVNDDPSAYDDAYTATTRSDQYMDPDAAFRESLFDALADDEGAAYWEGVYGQPIHTYPIEHQTPTGELERMTDEEYAEYVRRKMWEKSHQHILEERERQDKERQKRKADEKAQRERTRYMQEEHDSFQRSVEASLKRGEERKAKKKWKEVWARYTKEWEDIAAGTADNGLAVKDLLPWPVESGKVKHVSKDEVEHFFRSVPLGEEELATQIKAERVRWHPDKIQHKFGERGIDEATMKAVTAIFQVIDRIWSEVRERKAKA